MDPLLKIIASTFIVDVLNRDISPDQMAQELKKRSILLKTDQISDFLVNKGVPKDPEAVQQLIETPEVQKWAKNMKLYA